MRGNSELALDVSWTSGITCEICQNELTVDFLIAQILHFLNCAGFNCGLPFNRLVSPTC